MYDFQIPRETIAFYWEGISQFEYCCCILGWKLEYGDTGNIAEMITKVFLPQLLNATLVYDFSRIKILDTDKKSDNASPIMMTL